MSQTLTQRSAAFFLSAAVTVVMLASVAQLFDRDAVQGELAQGVAASAPRA